MNVPDGSYNLGESPVGTAPNGTYLDKGGFLGFLKR